MFLEASDMTTEDQSAKVGADVIRRLDELLVRVNSTRNMCGDEGIRKVHTSVRL